MAEIEAFCRLFRHAEQLHSAVMNVMRTNAISIVDQEPNRGDVSEVEEKVASGLAHVMSLLHAGKDEILGARRRENHVEESSPEERPPFARLRDEVRLVCSNLENLLESLLPPDSQEGLAARERMLKLKNACLDAGFPRPDGVPIPADIPNLAPVRLRPSKSARTLYKDDNVAFWRGGHITEAGLSWLVEKGFKTIVDLREGSAQPIALSPLPEAVASGKVNVVRMPVERGKGPSKDQVEEFARLVADPANKPLYLHTKAGVRRASAMVTRWREVALREQFKGLAKPGGFQRSINRDEPLSVDDSITISPEDALALLNATKKIQNEGISVLGNGSLSTDSESASAAPVETALTSAGQSQDGQASVNGVMQSEGGQFVVAKNAFESQRPVPNVLNRKAMSKFMKRRRVPSLFFCSRMNRPIISPSLAPKKEAARQLNGSLAGPANRWVRNNGNPRADFSEANKQAAEVSSTPVDGGKDVNGNPILTKNGNTREESKVGIGKKEEQVDKDESRGLDVSAKESNGSLNGSATEKSSSDEDEPVSVQGDMCASTTGVVRLQSRKKAEMFLVRTDGYSCTRELVKESTLAFTHPSTQQQMLMWKTPPRTVLLLKKLGSELTKEAQEVLALVCVDKSECLAFWFLKESN
jgi:NAD+ kinase